MNLGFNGFKISNPFSSIYLVEVPLWFVALVLFAWPLWMIWTSVSKRRADRGFEI